MQEKKVALIGFGNVARVLARLLVEKQPVLQQQYGFSTRVVAIGTGHHGMALNPAGIDVEQGDCSGEQRAVSGISFHSAAA